MDQREVSMKIENEFETTDYNVDPIDMNADFFDDPETLQFKEKQAEDTVDFFDFTSATYEQFAAYMSKIHG